MTYLVLRAVHLVSMALWIGALLFVSGDVKRTLSGSADGFSLLDDRVRRALRLANIAGGVTFLSGLGLIFTVGGFAAVKPPIHIGMTLALIMLGVGGALVGRSYRQVRAGNEKGQPSAELMPHAKRMMVGTIVIHSLWLVTLLLMVFRNGVG